MKTRALLLSVVLLLGLNSCVVKSLHQFFQEEDVVWEESLNGSWIDEDGSRWVISPYTFPKGYLKGDSTDNSYLVELYEDSLEVQKFNVHLFRLNGRNYLDFRPILDDSRDDFLHVHMVPTHSLALVDRDEQGRWTIGWFNEDWLNRLFQENRVKISHEVVKGKSGDAGDQYVLTASTEELQKFVEKYGIPGDKPFCSDEDNFLCVRLSRNE